MLQRLWAAIACIVRLDLSLALCRGAGLLCHHVLATFHLIALKQRAMMQCSALRQVQLPACLLRVCINLVQFVLVQC
jgi:hypothetical protein